MNNVSFEDLITYIRAYNPSEVENVVFAYEYAKEKHAGQFRQSGEEYIIHPVNVAYTLAKLHADGDTLCAGLLHDTLEDTNTTYDDIKDLFNERVAILVDGVTKLNKKYFNTKEDASVANTRKILNGLKADVRIIAIKLADRLHNMQTLNYKSPEKQKQIADETLRIYCPLAYHIGAYAIKNNLEDLAFFYLNEPVYNMLKEDREKILDKNNDTIKDMQSKIENILKDNSIPYEVKFRLKSVYGIYKQMKSGHNLTNIHDLLALKIMVDEIANCYKTLGLIHNTYRPMNSKFKDYIASPKNNLYQSLHTTVFGPSDELVQMQIRTFAMNHIDEYGLMAYWDTAKGLAGKLMQNDLRNKFSFYRALQHIDALYPKDEDFLKQVQSEILGKKIGVFTSDGRMIELPEGATPIDLAYEMSTDIGNHLVDVIVNDEFTKPDAVLHNKDYVKIITDVSSNGPKPDWENVAITTRARRKISEYYHKQ